MDENAYDVRATAGLEPATHSLGNCRSIQLSYGRNECLIIAFLHKEGNATIVRSPLRQI